MITLTAITYIMPMSGPGIRHLTRTNAALCLPGSLRVCTVVL